MGLGSLNAVAGVEKKGFVVELDKFNFQFDVLSDLLFLKYVVIECAGHSTTSADPYEVSNVNAV